MQLPTSHVRQSRQARSNPAASAAGFVLSSSVGLVCEAVSPGRAAHFAGERDGYFVGTFAFNSSESSCLDLASSSVLSLK
jgi:hypothetical protein